MASTGNNWACADATGSTVTNRLCGKVQPASQPASLPAKIKVFRLSCPNVEAVLLYSVRLRTPR